jgi:hypothetical protein
VPTGRTVWHLFGTQDGRLLASLEPDTRSHSGSSPHGLSALFDLAAPEQPKLVAEIPNSGGRSAGLLSAEDADYLVCPGGIFRLTHTGLAPVAVDPPRGSTLDGYSYHGAADGAFAAIATDDAVYVVAVRQ